ncbi:MAG: RNA 2',3'-cyclic phosphodiesterase [Pseudomonadota bacterium]
MRAFLALLPDADTALDIDRWRTLCWRDLPGAVAVQNLHVTLAFLGDIDEDQQARLAASLDAVVGLPISLHLSAVGYQIDQRMLWLEPPADDAGRPALDTLVESLRHACARAGIAVDKGRYRPHLTLARRLATPAPSPFVDPDVRLRADTISLMSSRLTPAGPVYRVVREWPLGSAQR